MDGSQREAPCLPGAVRGAVRGALAVAALRGAGIPSEAGDHGHCGSGWELGVAVAPLQPAFSIRAFYLERSNLPTDASSTAMKIDQVCPQRCSLGRVGFQGQDSAGLSGHSCPAWESPR